jgi:hypothetical protein
MAVALTALFVALGGTGYAATKLSAGRSEAAHVAVKHKKHKTTTVLVRCAATTVTCKGKPGPAGPQGSQGSQGTSGLKGDPGATNSYPATLPSGQTERGVFAGEADDVGNANAHTYATAAFPIPLAGAPTANIIQSGGASTAQCPGSSANPQATAGNLCVYVNNSSGAVTVFDPSNPANPINSSKWGATISIISSGAAYEYGTWAVTAP